MSQSRPLHQPAPGAVLVTSGNSKLANITIQECRDPDQSWRTGTHVGGFLDQHWLIEARRNGKGIMGLMRASVQPVLWGESQRQMLQSGTHWIVFVPDPALNGIELLTYQHHALRTLNKPYSPAELVLQVLDERRERKTGKRSYKWRKLGGLIKGNGICSKWTATPFVKAHLWPKEMLLLDPDSQLDWMMETIEMPYRGRRWIPAVSSAEWDS